MKVKEITIVFSAILFMLVFFILPPTGGVIDFLLMISIGISILILFTSLYLRKILDTSLLPTILLIATLFRLAINISTTRLIIGTGDAGNIIRSLGSFITGWSLVVGCIVFGILVLLTFIVVTKCSNRVTEVISHFMPNEMSSEQMAIDADLNSEIIREDEAKTRHKKSQEKSTFFAAMDGTSKFIKNDAIAGIILIVINIVAGVLLNITGVATEQPLSLTEALKLYAVLTIGAGIVSQIPTLLMSVSMGIVTNKVSLKI